MTSPRERFAYFFAFLFVALALGPSLAHLLELPNKVGLPQDAYFTVQQIYRGWALLGFVVAGALVATLVLAAVIRRQRRPMMWAAAAFFCIVGAQIVFWSWTYPANAATDNWTVVPQDWEALRQQWEYSHAAGAALNLAAMLALIVSVLDWQRPQSGNNA